MILANSVCERHGEVDRKRRSDAGRVANDAKRLRSSTSVYPPSMNVTMDPKGLEEEEEDDDHAPGDVVPAMCNTSIHDEGSISMILLDEMPTTNTNGNDNSAYEIAQV
jgi:hypothetical protein